MDYELYHDESKESGYWHGMLLVPVSRKDALVELLCRARENAKYPKPVGIKKTRRRDRKSACVEAWVSIGVASAISRQDRARCEVYMGKLTKGRREYEFVDCFVGLKFILFREVDAHSTMIGHVDHGSKVETTMRMGLKGGLHLLACEDSPVRIVRLHFDGWQHHRRHIDGERVVGRMAGLRSYCQVMQEIDDRSSDHTRSDSQEYADCQLLQLADVMIGAFRSAFGSCTNEHQRRVADQVRPIVERYRAGPSRMRHSRWHRSFAFSQCQLVDGSWCFKEIASSREIAQHALF